MGKIILKMLISLVKLVQSVENMGKVNSLILDREMFMSEISFVFGDHLLMLHHSFLQWQ